MPERQVVSCSLCVVSVITRGTSVGLGIALHSLVWVSRMTRLDSACHPHKAQCPVRQCLLKADTGLNHSRCSRCMHKPLHALLQVKCCLQQAARCRQEAVPPYTTYLDKALLCVPGQKKTSQLTFSCMRRRDTIGHGAVLGRSLPSCTSLAGCTESEGRNGSSCADSQTSKFGFLILKKILTYQAS